MVQVSTFISVRITITITYSKNVFVTIIAANVFQLGYYYTDTVAKYFSWTCGI